MVIRSPRSAGLRGRAAPARRARARAARAAALRLTADPDRHRDWLLCEPSPASSSPRQGADRASLRGLWPRCAQQLRQRRSGGGADSQRRRARHARRPQPSVRAPPPLLPGWTGRRLQVTTRGRPHVGRGRPGRGAGPPHTRPSPPAARIPSAAGRARARPAARLGEQTRSGWRAGPGGWLFWCGPRSPSEHKPTSASTYSGVSAGPILAQAAPPG